MLSIKRETRAEINKILILTLVCSCLWHFIWILIFFFIFNVTILSNKGIFKKIIRVSPISRVIAKSTAYLLLVSLFKSFTDLSLLLSLCLVCGIPCCVFMYSHYMCTVLCFFCVLIYSIISQTLLHCHCDC